MAAARTTSFAFQTRVLSVSGHAIQRSCLGVTTEQSAGAIAMVGCVGPDAMSPRAKSRRFSTTAPSGCGRGATTSQSLCDRHVSPFATWMRTVVTAKCVRVPRAARRAGTARASRARQLRIASLEWFASMSGVSAASTATATATSTPSVPSRSHATRRILLVVSTCPRGRSDPPSDDERSTRSMSIGLDLREPREEPSAIHPVLLGDRP